MTMDYIDASNFVVEDAESDIDEIEEVMVRKTRGKDIDWEKIEVFRKWQTCINSCHKQIAVKIRVHAVLT